NDAGDLLIIEDTEGGHVEFKDLFFDTNGAAKAVQDDSDHAFRRAADPFRAGQRGSESFLTKTVPLMAGDAGGLVNQFPRVESLLVLSRKFGHFDRHDLRRFESAERKLRAVARQSKRGLLDDIRENMPRSRVGRELAQQKGKLDLHIGRGIGGEGENLIYAQ